MSAMDVFLEYILPLLIGFTVSSVFGVLFWRHYLRSDRFEASVSEGIALGFANAAKETTQQALEESALKNATNFLVTPKLFLYFDRDVVNSLYAQIAASEKTTGIERETVKETEKGIKANLSIAEPSYAKRGLEREKKQIEIVESPEGRHDALLKHLVASNSVEFGIDQFRYDNRADEEFMRKCSDLERAAGTAKLPPAFKEEYLHANKAEQIDKKMKEIESSKGKFVLMHVDCGITMEAGGNAVLSFSHPLNSIRTPLQKWGGEEVMIRIRLSPNHITEFGKDEFSTMKKRNVKVFGTLGDVDLKSEIIAVRAISIY
ncbi:MAG: hypothetical protein ABR962_10525 [Candidatus Bathyarchaeia archaeon]|jgi:hypothetical protein